MSDCKKFVKMAGQTLIKQQALIMATSDDKGYDLDKYTKKVIAEMEENEMETSQTTGNKNKETCKDTKKKSFDELMYGKITLRWTFYSYYFFSYKYLLLLQSPK